jgi:hypothetical protein
MQLKNLPHILFKFDTRNFYCYIFFLFPTLRKLQKMPFTILCATLWITRFVLSIFYVYLLSRGFD